MIIMNNYKCSSGYCLSGMCPRGSVRRASVRSGYCPDIPPSSSPTSATNHIRRCYEVDSHGFLYPEFAV